MTDIYALGVMLYEMVTGVPPYTRGDHMSVMYQHVQGKARPPQEVNPSLPPGLAELVMRAMAVDKTKRFQSMEARRSSVSGTEPSPPPGTRDAPPQSPAPGHVHRAPCQSSCVRSNFQPQAVDPEVPFRLNRAWLKLPEERSLGAHRRVSEARHTAGVLGRAPGGRRAPHAAHARRSAADQVPRAASGGARRLHIRDPHPLAERALRQGQ